MQMGIPRPEERKFKFFNLYFLTKANQFPYFYDTMRLFLMTGGYIIIPLIVALVFKLLKIKWVFIAYIATAILICFYPYYQNEVEYYFHPESRNMKCGTGAGALMIGNFICALPATLMIQGLFNYLFLNAFFIKRK